MLARQGKLNEELKQLKKVKKQLMESIVANMDGTTSEDMDAQREKKLDEDKRLIDDKIIEVDWEGNMRTNCWKFHVRSVMSTGN